MQKVVLNIPHSSTITPDWAVKDIIIPATELSLLVDFMTDKDVDKIWDFVPNGNKQVATVSRLVVDTERYRNDEDEAMALKGMGLYYTRICSIMIELNRRIYDNSSFCKVQDICKEIYSELNSR